jgi:hypothetical protein
MSFCDLYRLGFEGFVLNLVDYLTKAEQEQLIHLDRVVAKPFLEWLRQRKRERQARRLALGLFIVDGPANGSRKRPRPFEALPRAGNLTGS